MKQVVGLVFLNGMKAHIPNLMEAKMDQNMKTMNRFLEICNNNNNNNITNNCQQPYNVWNP